MAISRKHPAEKLTVGAQYICFNTEDADHQWTDTFDTEVSCYPTVTNVSVEDNGDSYKDYASGDVYESGNKTSTKKIETENVAFDDLLVAKMKGDVVNATTGVIEESGTNHRPFFAYGIYVKKDNNVVDLRWYPKTQHTENSDETKTSEDSHEAQTDKLTMEAFSFANDNKCIRRIYEGSSAADVDAMIKLFFAKPLLTGAEAGALSTASASHQGE
jgi:phi13 family phage major tail protein